MKKSLLILTLFSCGNLFGQFGASRGVLHKEFSKSNTQYLAKTYMAQMVMTTTTEPQNLMIDAVTASESGELTCLYYDCDGVGKGLLFAFWGKRVNESGVAYNAYDFIHFKQEEAQKMMNKIEDVHNKFMETHTSYTGGPNDNYVFKYGEFEFIINAMFIRVYWNEFDSHWRVSEFKKTKRKFEKAIK